MTVRITVHNDCTLPGSVTGVREMAMVAGDTILGPAWFLAAGKEQTFFLHDHQYLIVVELKRGAPGHPETALPPAPVTPEPVDVLS
jgi:hypothetical protein